MEFQNAKQISPENLQKINYDIFILVAGYEQRSIFLPKNYDVKADVKIAFAFEEKPKELNRKSNDEFLLKNGFKFIPLSGEQNLDLKPVLSELLKNSGKEHLYLLIDYSSMTKVWYSGIINYLIANSKTCDYVTIHFSYTPALYNVPRKNVPVKINSLVSYPCKKETESDKPIALIIGLGLDNTRAEFIRKQVNPALTCLLYADPANDINYVQKVLKSNQQIIEQVEVRNLFSFPLHDLNKTDEIITNLCLDLRIKYNIVIAPVGSKVLSLLSLLLASRYPDINVLRVSSGANAPVFERTPFCEPLLYSVEFVSDELES